MEIVEIEVKEEKSCLDCIFYNYTERYCVLWGTYLSSLKACKYYRTSWGQIRWLRSFLEDFERENNEEG